MLETSTLLVCDGLLGPGQVMAHDALERAIARAQGDGCCILALRNSHHLGRIGHWAEQCAAAGLVSVHFVNVVSEPLVAPFGGVTARLGTNPFAVGIPRSNHEPIIVDFATSKWAAGKVRVAYNSGQNVPSGTLVDAQGHPTNDPGVLFNEPKGALLPFGDHKGWGLALACELLGAALTGGKAQTGPKSREAIINSMCSILISPAHLGTSDSFQAQTEAFLQWIMSDARTSIFLAGDPERQTKSLRAKTGVPIDIMSWGEIIAAGEAVGLAHRLRQAP